MKKMLLLLVVVGVLIMGIFAVTEELSERSCEKGAYIESEIPMGDIKYGGAAPCGGGDGGGPGGAPG